MSWPQPLYFLGLFAALAAYSPFSQPAVARNNVEPVAEIKVPVNYVPTAQTYVVLDLDSGRMLYAKNPDQRMFPASTTKMMMSLVAYEHGDPNQVIRVGKDAANTGESGIGLLEGEQLTLDSLLKAALIHSANDSCVAIAEGVGGTEARFVGWMNQKARELGCHNTHFVNPHGLHDPNHYTTARDLATIGRALARTPYLAAIADTKATRINGNYKTGGTRLLVNRNKLLFRWPACDGLKTGYTHQAGNCLVATATEVDPATGKKWRLLSVVMKCTPGRSWPDGEWLLQQAFANYRPRWVVTNNQTLWSGPVAGGAASLSAMTKGEIEMPLRADENDKIEKHVEILDDLKAPIKAGQVVGSVAFYTGTTSLGRVPLQAGEAVPETLLTRAMPSLGYRVSAWSPALRFGVFGGFCLMFAALLIAMRPKKRPKAKRSVKTRDLPENVPTSTRRMP